VSYPVGVPSTQKDDARLTNLLAAVALGLADGLQAMGAELGGLDAGAATALVALLDFSPSGSLRRLSMILGLTHSGTVRLVDRLVLAGLAERRAGSDERSRAVVLTKKGRIKGLAVRALRQSRTEMLLEGLSQRQREELSRACEVMIGNLTRHRLAERESGSAPAGGALCRLCDFVACGRSSGRCPAFAVAASRS